MSSHADIPIPSWAILEAAADLIGGPLPSGGSSVFESCRRLAEAFLRETAAGVKGRTDGTETPTSPATASEPATGKESK